MSHSLTQEKVGLMGQSYVYCRHIFVIYFSMINVGKMRVQIDLSRDGNRNRNLQFVGTKYDVPVINNVSLVYILQKNDINKTC